MKSYKNIFLMIAIFFGTCLPSLQVIAEEESMGTVLITGANRGIGLALAEKFSVEGYSVIATARNPAKADALNALNVQVETLDVTDAASVNKLSTKIKQPIDILLNNAGISGHSSSEFESLDVDKLLQTFDVNGLGALRVTQAFLPNLQKGEKKLVASISSIMGSIANNKNPGAMGYRASKAALNSFNQSLAAELGSRGFRFVVLHPGWVRTDMGSSSATYSVKESADGLFAVISGLKAEDNGRFYDLHGKTVAW
ncbi:MAG: SDR family oxidoreductase [Oceanicoccus sp.]